MSAPEAFVFGGEEVRWSGRPRLMAVLPAVVSGGAIVVGAIVVSIVSGGSSPLLLVPVGLALPVWRYLVVTRTRFVVTDEAVYLKRGVLSREVRRMGLERVQNSSFAQGVRGSLFGYGTVDIEAAGGGTIRFHDVMDPRDVRALVDRRALDSSRGVGSVDQWEAVLEEVRAWRTALESGSGGSQTD